MLQPSEIVALARGLVGDPSDGEALGHRQHELALAYDAVAADVDVLHDLLHRRQVVGQRLDGVDLRVAGVDVLGEHVSQHLLHLAPVQLAVLVPVVLDPKLLGLLDSDVRPLDQILQANRNGKRAQALVVDDASSCCLHHELLLRNATIFGDVESLQHLVGRRGRIELTLQRVDSRLQAGDRDGREILDQGLGLFLVKQAVAIAVVDLPQPLRLLEGHT